MKKVPLGISEFKKIIENNYYFVDKSLLIKEIIEDGSEVILFSRPRRFGKTLNISMLKYFFEKTHIDNSKLFLNLNIWKYKQYRDFQGKHPVIYLTFKDVKYKKWDDMFLYLKVLISDEYRRHKHIITSDKFCEEERDYFKKIISKNSDNVDLTDSLKKLTEFLYRYYEEKVIVLIDEYDTPIECSYIYGFYEDLIFFMRNFLSGGLKDNYFLQKSILTGILRIGKESIFSGLNNLKVETLLDERYSSYFGLLDHEVIELLDCYEMSDQYNDIKTWYNGYLFGNDVIYNPWSIVNAVNNNGQHLKPYWVNSSDNVLVKSLITKSGYELKVDLEELLKRNSIEKTVNEDIIYGEIENDTNSVWSFLFFNGYLKQTTKVIKGRDVYCSLKIPNEEVYSLYEQIVKSWFSQSINNDKYELMLKSLLNGDILIFEKILKEFAYKSFSYFDTGGQESEKTYHAFVLGLLVSLSKDYEVKSNRESGYGRYDVVLIPKDVTKVGIIFEFKSVDKFYSNENLEVCAEKALNQIIDKGYCQELINRGIRKIIMLGISFSGKDVCVRSKGV